MHIYVYVCTYSYVVTCACACMHASKCIQEYVDQMIIIEGHGVRDLKSGNNWLDTLEKRGLYPLFWLEKGGWNGGDPEFQGPSRPIGWFMTVWKVWNKMRVNSPHETRGFFTFKCIIVRLLPWLVQRFQPITAQLFYNKMHLTKKKDILQVLTRQMRLKTCKISIIS